MVNIGLTLEMRMSLTTHNKGPTKQTYSPYTLHCAKVKMVNREPLSFKSVASSHRRKVLISTLGNLGQWSRSGEGNTERIYLRETQGQLDIGLQGDHSEEIYRGFRDHCANQR